MSNLIADNTELRARVAELEAELDRTRLKLTNLTSERDQAQKAARQTQVGRRIAEAARKAGALDIALVDIEHRALQGDWREEGARLRLYENGIPAYNDRGEPIYDTAWVAGLKKEAGHFFTPIETTTSVVQMGGHKSAAFERNPFDHRSPSFSLTEQGRIVRENKEKARKMAIAAGWDERKVLQAFGEPDAA
jgi:hypothetical protein